MSAAAIATMLADLCELRSYLASIPGPPSPMGATLDAARTGILGDGCSARYPTAGREMRRAPSRPLSYARMWSVLAERPGHSVRVWLLSPVVLDLARQTTAQVMLSPGPGRRAHSLALPERLGWDYATATQRARWGILLRVGDGRPSRIAMASAGTALLEQAAAEWVSAE